VHANDRKNICLLWRPSGGEGNRTPDLLNAIQALSQLSYAPGALGNAKLTFPSGTAKNSRGYIECQEIGASETYFGRYFARGGNDHVGNARSPPLRLTRALRAFALRDIWFGSTAAPSFHQAFRCSVVAFRPSPLIDAYFHAQDLFEAIMTEVKKPRRRRAAPAGIAPNEPERDILDQYLYEVSTYPLLKGTEEIELAKKIRAGDQDSLQELVKRNLRFVISVAKKYQNRGLPLIDLIGEGNVGLLTAARKFDPDQGVKFISYAVWWIRQAILSALARQGRTVRVPLNRTADLSRIIKASEILRQKLNREPSPEELSQLTGLSVDVVQSLAALNTSDVRLDAPMDPEGDRSLIERFVADEMPDTEEEAMNRFLTDEIEQALSTLPPRDAKVLRLYFGLEGGREHTLEEIGSMLGVTRERVRQLRDRALKRLREGDVGRALGSFAA
jgi:RNA polymerase primary sigma factor